MKNLVIIGGGEHAQVVAEAAKDKWNILGYTDNDENSCGYMYLGDDTKIMELVKNCPDLKFIFGMGDLTTRKKLVEKYNLTENLFASIIHQAAIISKSAKIAHGSFVGAGAIIQSNVQIDNHSIINTGVIIEHDCHIGNYTHIASGTVLGGGCMVDELSFLGLGSRVKDHVSIGKNVVVGAGSVVINKIENNKIIAGIPAKILK